MAEGDAAAAAPAKGGMGFLKQKVGPLPLAAWLVIGIALWWYLQKKNTAASGSAVPNQQTDPAGNIGSIDPATGYVYGTPEDTAALASNNAGVTPPAGGGGSGASSGGATATGQTYADNNAWGEAAINYLVGLGIDPAAANEAIQQYLSSQTLTSQQQADVNEAIQALGAPPSLPGPTGTPPTPVVVPPTVTTTTPTPPVNATNPVTGLTVASKQATTIGLKWNQATNATGYTIRYGKTPGATTWSTTAPASQDGITIGNLAPGTMWYFQVQATPAAASAGSASVSAQTAKTSGTPAPANGKAPGSPAPKTYTVAKGDTLSGIAAKLRYPGGWQALYAKNKSVVGSNPNLIKPGEVLQV